MKKAYFLLLSAELLFGASLFAATSEIQLSGRKGAVLQSKVRLLVLDVADECLNRENDAFVVSIDGMKNPYAFKEDEVVPVIGDTVVAEEAEPVVAPVVYDNASILEAVAASFSKQVRGTLARGEKHFLQLQGGGMIKPDTRFSVKLPQLDGQSFTVTILDISSRGYTLELQGATLTVPYGKSSGAAAGATKDALN